MFANQEAGPPTGFAVPLSVVVLDRQVGDGRCTRVPPSGIAQIDTESLSILNKRIVDQRNRDHFVDFAGRKLKRSMVLR